MGEKAAFWLVVGGALVAFGTFLPWITLSSDRPVGGIEIGQTGKMDGDGMLTLAGGFVIALIGGALARGNRHSRLQLVLLWIAFLVVTAVWIINFRDIQERIGLVDSEFDSVSVGHGMWVMALGGFIALVAILNLPASPEPNAGSEPQ